jgi:alkylation response protein AidB-like acyl-CoA dehydrogenase
LLELDEQQLAIQRTARRFAHDVIRPNAARVDAEARFPLEELQRAWGLGVMFGTVPAACGGAGLDLFTECLIEEEIAWGCAGFTSSWVTGALAIHAIARFGTEDQQRRWLAPLTTSFGLCAFALSEPGAGSDIAGLTTTAERRGDAYVLHGTKQWVTTAGHADVFVVFASVDRKARERGITAFVVERGTPGFEIGRKETTLGIRSSDSHQIHFEGCAVPASQRLGEERQGFEIARSATQHSRPLVASMANGISRAALEHCVRYALERKINHAPLATYQATQLKLADMAKQLHASRLLTFDAARRLDRGLDAEREAAMAKILATDTAMAITTEAVQIFGAYGLTPEYPVEKLFRDAKVLQIIEGTNEVLRLLVAADLVTCTLRERGP